MAERRATDAEILAQIPEARRSEREARASGRRAVAVRVHGREPALELTLTNRAVVSLPIANIEPLVGLTAAQLRRVELDAAGAALRWPDVDVDLSVAGLLLSLVEPAAVSSFWAAMAGQKTSTRKSAAAQRNGAKGGRPKKVIRITRIKDVKSAVLAGADRRLSPSGKPPATKR